jgi:hypothetical protein
VSGNPTIPPMKACRKCGRVLSLDAFHREKRNDDGHTGTCKVCAALRQAKWNADHPDQVRSYKQKSQRKRYAADPAKYNCRKREQRLANPEVMKRRAERNKAALRAKRAANVTAAREKERMTRRDPVERKKFSARDKVKHALRIGTLTRLPCEVCGTTRTHGHHDDYSKPLAVRWLCARHHREHHMQHGESPA